jgi:hypothetical protein
VVARYDHAVGAVEVDGIAELPGAAITCAGPRDAVAGNDRAILSLLPTVNENAAIAAADRRFSRIPRPVLSIA